MPEIRQRKSFILAITFVLAMPAIAQAVQPVAYEAIYDVYMDGKRRMETRVSATREGDQWVLGNHGKGVKGLARFLNARSSESSRVLWHGDSIEPVSFTHHSKIAGRDDRWSAEFDWGDGVVNTVHEDGESSLSMPPGTLDPLSLTLVLRQNLEQGKQQWLMTVVDEDEIDEHSYSAGDPETLQTSLGCLEVIPVERVRENSLRYSKGWYAPALDFFPVRIRHGKRGDRDFDMRIRQLSLAGEAVDKRPDCT